MELIRSTEGFTLAQLTDFATTFAPDARWFNSNMTEEYTIRMLQENSFSFLEAITGIDPDQYGTTACAYVPYHIGEGQPINMNYVLENRSLLPEMVLERDIEDGFVFSTYQTVIIHENHLVLF